MPRDDLFAPQLIIGGDLHTADLAPECRSDNYLDALLQKEVWLGAMQHQYGDIPIIRPGDVFNHWAGGGTEVINRLLAVWPRGPVLAVPGQHDLPQHNVTLQRKTAFQNLVMNGRMVDVAVTPFFLADGIHVVRGCAWGQQPPAPPVRTMGNILVWHVTTWQKPFMPGQLNGDAERLLRMHKGYDLICTGDNHQTFVVADGIRQLVNAGSEMRMTAAQIDHKPCVYLWQAGKPVKQVFFPISPGVISREKVEQAREKEERTSAFVSKLEGGDEIACSFNDNIEVMLKEENSDVCTVVRECLNV
jgi:hypothetical protein